MRKTQYRLIAGVLAIVGVLLWAQIMSAPVSAQTATPNPFIFPTPTITLTPGCAAPLDFVPGDYAFVRPGVNLRSGPSASSPLVHYFTSWITLKILGGPICSTNYNWWQVDGVGYDGWVAEGRPGFYFLVRAQRPDEGCPTPINFTIGGTLQFANGVRVHDQPSEDALVLTVTTRGQEAQIVGGPQCYNGTNWWQVRLPYGVDGSSGGGVVDGWVTEGPAYDNFLLPEGALSITPTQSCMPGMPHFAIGDQGRVIGLYGQTRNLRTAPGENSPLLFSLIGDISFTVIGGPACSDGMNWWQVQLIARPDVIGWIAEGGPGNYWIQELY